MRWPAKPPKVSPVIGAKRAVRRFAWLPMRVDTCEEQPLIVWLEHYIAQQEYDGWGYGSFGWRTLARYSDGPV